MGPEVEDPDLDELEEIRLGWFGPDDSENVLHGDLWVAASLAVEEANRRGGYRGKPFRLIARWSESPWATGVAELVRLAYEDRVWALLGSVDGAGTHLAEQVVAKVRLPLISPVSTDISVNLAGVPWMFSLAPADPAWAPVLVDRLLAECGARDFVLVAGTDHDSRLATEAVLGELSRHDRGPVLRADLAPESEAGPRELAPWIARDPAAVLLVAGAEHGARVVRALRSGGFEGTIFGSPRMGRRAFRVHLGGVENGLVYPELTSPSPQWPSFADRFRGRTGREPDWAAGHSYDATRILLEALERVGPSRSRIRQELADMPTWTGVTGPIRWDPTGQNSRPVAATRSVSDPP